MVTGLACLLPTAKISSGGVAPYHLLSLVLATSFLSQANATIKTQPEQGRGYGKTTFAT